MQVLIHVIVLILIPSKPANSRLKSLIFFLSPNSIRLLSVWWFVEFWGAGFEEKSKGGHGERNCSYNDSGILLFTKYLEYASRTRFCLICKLEYPSHLFCWTYYFFMSFTLYALSGFVLMIVNTSSQTCKLTKPMMLLINIVLLGHEWINYAKHTFARSLQFNQ